MKNSNQLIFLSLLFFSYCVLAFPSFYRDTCQCFHFEGHDPICPGSTFQFEEKGWHGSCEDKVIEDGKCACKRCNSCFLIDTVTFK